jgi:hypothetical protein
MKDGRIVVETLKLSSVERHQDLVEPGMAGVIYGSEPQSPWLAQEFEPSPAPCLPASSPSVHREKAAIAGPTDEMSRERGSKTLCVLGQSGRKAVPTLRKKTLKVSGRVPRILPVKFSHESKDGDDEPIVMESLVPVSPMPVLEPVPELEPVDAAPVMDSPLEPVALDLPSGESPQAELPSVEIPSQVQVQFIPTPKKRGPRSLAAEEEPSSLPVNKPLKVIRKRGEQEPKVFETAPKPVPQAMLEGIKKPQENGDQPE